jgi:hypothetical protein
VTSDVYVLFVGIAVLDRHGNPSYIFATEKQALMKLPALRGGCRLEEGVRMKSNDRTRMLLVGDIVATEHPGGLRFFLEKAAPELRQGEIVYGNLEFPMTDRGRYDSSKYWVQGRRMKPEDILALSAAGFHVVSLANNHMMDFGPDGLLQTIELLDSRNIIHCGAGRNLAEARKPAILERDGLRVAFLAYTSVFIPSFPASKDRPGVVAFRVESAYMPHPRAPEQPGIPPIVLTFPNRDDLDGVLEDIRTAKARADIVVVSWHWGVSQGHRKRVPYQMEVGRACIDAGASLIVGHHPHALLGVEAYKKGIICYSLGNFIFWSGRPPGSSHDLKSLMLECEIDRKGLRRVALRPVLINAEYQPEIIHETDSVPKLLEVLIKDSEEFKTPFRHEDDRLVLDVAD